MFKNKRPIHFLRNLQHQYDGLYFEIITYKGKYLLYYNTDTKASTNKIAVIISDTLVFNTKSSIVIQNAPGGVFCIINDNNSLYMLCGCHISNKEPNEISLPDLVWPKEKRTILDWKKNRKDRKNGMYLLQSNNGINWKEVVSTPVLHAYIQSPTCKLGEIGFDTHPCILKYNQEYYFYGRLNTSLDERRIYVRKSTDLIHWSEPVKIKIQNEDKGRFKNNFYQFIVYEHNNILYAFTPHFKACGTTKRRTIGGEKTLHMKSEDGIHWTIINSFLHTKNRYEQKVNSVLIENNQILVFFREHCLARNQRLTSYNFTTENNVVSNKSTEKTTSDNNSSIKRISFRYKVHDKIMYSIDKNNENIVGTIRAQNKDGSYWIVLDNGYEKKDVSEEEILKIVK